MDIVAIIEGAVTKGDAIPKPTATEPFLVKGWGIRRGERALIYTIPNKQGGKRYEKGITISEIRMAFERLSSHGYLDRSWFNEHLSACAKEGGCNFTTLGGLFQKVGKARYDGPASYATL